MNKGYSYLLTIKNKSVLRLTTHSELQYQLHVWLRRHTECVVYDVGVHGNSKYFHLHLHIILFSASRFVFVKHTPASHWYFHIRRITTPLYKVIRYIHADDHNNCYKLEQLLIENDYFHMEPRGLTVPKRGDVVNVF